MTTMLLEWVFTSVFLVLTVLALRAAFGKRVSARLRYALWAVVLVRLLVPVPLFTSPIAGTWVLTENRSEQDVTDVPSLPSVPVHTEGDAAQSLGGQAGPSAILSNFPQAPSVPTLPDPPKPPAAPDLTKLPRVLGWVWLGGSAAMALVLAASNLRFARRLRRCRVPLEGTDCSLPVYEAVGLPSPCLFGILRPAIYVTPEAAANPAMLRHVIAHEHTHYRHGDHLWSFLRCAALAAHWWNPLVWLAVTLSRRDGELACDEGALKRLGDGERLAYGNTLLALVTAKPGPGDLLCFATTMAGEKKSLKERFSRIACAPKRWLWAALAVVLVTALACVCAFGTAAEPEDEPEPDPTPAPTRDLGYEVEGMEFVMRDPVTLLAAPDLNRNGVAETVIVGDFYNKADLELSDEEREARGWPLSRVSAAVEVWEGDELLWTGEASDIHAGETSFLLYSEDGKDYLMEFNIYGQQGQADGRYRIFTLEGGREATVRENHAEFDYSTDSLASVTDNFDPKALAAFVDEVDGLLAHCTLLVDTGYNYRENQDPLKVNLTWLENYAAGFEWLDGQSALENLTRFKLMAGHPFLAMDLNGNMIPEMIRVYELEDKMGQRVELFEERRDGGDTVWSEEGHYAHAGYNAIFLCTLDGKDYLLRYHPYMAQGWADYSYQLFTLTRDGQEKVVRENHVGFDIDFYFHPASRGGFDPEAIADFMDEINGLLANSTQIINTDADLLGTFLELGRLEDDLWWLDLWAPQFVRDEGKSLRENLRAYKEAMEAAQSEWNAQMAEEEPLNARYLAVIQGNKLLYSPERGERMTLDELCAKTGPGTYTRDGITDFSVLDLDGDGVQEVILNVDPGEHRQWSIVLHDQDGEVRGYEFYIRWLNTYTLKEDGAFDWSSSAFENGWGKLRFTEDGYETEDTIWHMDRTYYLGSQTVSKAEYDAAYNRQDAVPDAVWYDFTEENLNAILG